MIPIQYNDEPAIPMPTTVEDDTPLDYSRGPHQQEFGDLGDEEVDDAGPGESDDAAG